MQAFVNTILPWPMPMRQSLCNLQKDNKKVLFRKGQLIPNFFIVHLPILVRCKTKGAFRALCALLRNWQLGANCQLLYVMWRLNFKGLSQYRGGGFFLKTSAPLL
jgi:hypothetical protein